MKKKTLVPLIIFLLGICLVSLIVYITDTHEKKQRHTMAQLNATVTPQATASHSGHSGAARRHS